MTPRGNPQFPSTLEIGSDLVLHAVRTDDADAIFALVDSNRLHLREWLPWVDGCQELQQTRDFLEHDARLRALGETATYLIQENNAIGGMIDLHAIDAINRSFLIGYWLAKCAEGRGLITRACRHLIKAAFEQYGMERAVIRCATGNTRSAAVPKRLGFVLEGLERHGQRLNAEFVDLERYSLLSKDWPQP
jgi:ribosomal-protein-serine acetyltransferase